ncbi:conserved hypothetical protein [Streptomyces sviceus ATCC 29083]|uniref:Uncharacterized protein n=1 Tax=Streptomyces sviceus (strain ATCC 29083 / DSM 924 / JCM 4929 / NBRC 13980 / NCIMB 11184 / NRRL 5439 / UC 5370) TaxID=463191 RepID=B5I1J1_STRX2|nr:conserved hypothetical protein [Streptomyces sviceus ATCC 29083]
MSSRKLEQRYSVLIQGDLSSPRLTRPRAPDGTLKPMTARYCSLAQQSAPAFAVTAQPGRTGEAGPLSGAGGMAGST